jgi:GTP-binding protein HflX
LLRLRITALKERLEKVRQTRAQGRAARQKAGVPTISLVGYTNSGKSTLFNRLAGADAYAADLLFATLDPTLRRIQLDGIGPVVLADTVGFVRHLPHQLIDAFRATLEETAQADLLLHIIDAASPDSDVHLVAVNEVLEEVGATAPVLLIYNKLDALPEQAPRIDYDATGKPQAVWISARDGQGIDLLLQAMQLCVSAPWETLTLAMTPDLARLRARFYGLGVVESELPDDIGGSCLRVRIQAPDLAQCLAREGLVRADVVVEAGVG